MEDMLPICWEMAYEYISNSNFLREGPLNSCLVFAPVALTHWLLPTMSVSSISQNPGSAPAEIFFVIHSYHCNGRSQTKYRV